MHSNHLLKMTCVFTALSWLTATMAAEGEDKKQPDLPLEGKTESLAFTTDEGSWLSLDITPDGETIIFDLLGDLYALPISGGQATRITSGLGFDSQPVVSPDGEWLAFISDRSGSNNLWVAKPDGSDARKLSSDKQWGSISPAWTPDSKYIVVTRRNIKNEFMMFHIGGGAGVKLSGAEEDAEVWGSGAEVSPDGKYLYFAQGVDSNGPVENFPVTQISRYDFATGAVDQITRGEGGAVRPALSPDGNLLVYGTRDETQTGFRIRNLHTGADRWLTYPVQRDAQENYRPPSRDLLPGYSFTPDGNAIVFNAEGKIWRVEINSRNKTEIPFTADIELDIGPDLTASYAVPQGPLTATLIHDPQLSPDGERITASVLTKLYVMDAEDGAEPRRLTSGDAWEFKPAWSPDGRWIAYVTWSMNDGGQIWRMRSNGSGRPQQLTDVPAFYTDLVYSRDGQSLLAMRGNECFRPTVEFRQ
jgi:Tol biopolymer transport system component